MKKHILIILLGINLTACTWVELTPEGQKVRLLSVSEVKACKNMGKTTVSLKDKIIGIERNKEKVGKELEALAKNSAIDLKGDTIVPVSEIKNGKQVFNIYRCINP